MYPLARFMKLNLGCGHKILKGYINLDKFVPYDEYIDLEEIPCKQFKDNTIDEILLTAVLEHTTNPIEIIKECHRILKMRGTIEIVVPFYNSHNAFKVTTHRSFFNLDSFNDLDYHLDAPERDNETRNLPKFKIKKYLEGTWIGRYIPYPIRNFIAIHFCNIGHSIHFTMTK